MNAQALAAVISHEVRQPLSAITANASAALRWLGRTPPDHGEIQAALNRIKSAGHRASEVFDGIRALFGKGGQQQEPIDINQIIVGVIESLRGDLKDRGIVARQELTTELPLVSGNAGQLREVFYNLINNALEAMNSTTNPTRVLRVRTELRGHDGVAVSVQDSGPGISPKQIESIFGAFVTTKPQGMGLGLAICRMIIEHHGGQISASSDGKHGALFQIVLPIARA
jgi:signal transduction histidine kinase